MCDGRILHWGPIASLAIIMWVTLSTVYCDTMWWPPESSFGGLANIIGFMALSCLTLFHYVTAIFDGPGYVPKGWRPKDSDDEDCLQWCDSCRGFKAPRSHHCRKCNRCVMKMDHHCPWINNCVGHANHGHFVGFLFFAVLGCLHASYSLGMALYYGMNRSWYYYYGTGHEPKVILTVFTLIPILFGFGLAIGVVLAVGALLYFQVRAVIRNQTGIEDWIMEKAAYRVRDTEEVFVNPYDLGRWKNFFFVVRPTCYPIGNGIDWPLREGASKYDLTMEQIRQKRNKRNRTKRYRIVNPFSGSWFPLWSLGLRVSCGLPCTDEPRIKLKEGDEVNVTRWKEHWLYGDKVQANAPPEQRVRGWFPKKCAVDLVLQGHGVADVVDTRRPRVAAHTHEFNGKNSETKKEK